MLSESDRIETTTIGDYLEQHPPRMHLNHIFSGSWISHNFDIWIGRREDNLAWAALARTRAYLESQQQRRTDIAAETWEAAWEAVYAAEGSDWFWWYGDDFNSAFDSEFDRLFRANLMQVYRLLGDDVPSYLTEPIINVGAARPTEQPTGFLKPTIDGQVTHFYEWVGAGSFDVRKSGGAMNIADTIISCLYWGFDLNTLFLRIDTSESPLEPEFADTSIIVSIEAGTRYRLDFTPPKTGEKPHVRVQEHTGDDTWKDIGEENRTAVEKIIELAVDFARFGIKPGDGIRMYVSVYKKHLEIERWPRNGYIEFPAPGEDFEAEMWIV
jgi:hypothetical protein